MNRGNRRALSLAAGEDLPAGPPAFSSATLIICADGGAALARRWGLKPHLVVGDLDSLSLEDQKFWREEGVPFHTVPARKDQTDLELAVELALEKGARSITLVGGWGSRIDHALGNVELLYRLALEGVENELLTSGHRLTAFSGQVKAKVSPGSFVSLIPLTPCVRGVRTRGLGYPLSGQDLHKGSTLGISNYALEGEIGVSLEEGVLLLICEQ